MDETRPVPLDVEEHLPFLARALEEDRASADVTSRALVDAEVTAVADVVAKGAGVIAGTPLVEPLFRFLDPEARVGVRTPDGERVAPGAVVLTVEGNARAILAAERTALDVLAHLSGIASLTAAFVAAVEGTGARILETRKTTPGWRVLEKYAVRCGGGSNHRLTLADAAMVKANHLRAAYGGTGPDAVREATRRLRRSLAPGVRLYVEVEDLEELEAALDERPDVVMLDNFTPEAVREAVRRAGARPPPRPEMESTGGVRLSNVRAFAEAGVGRISVGALTHSAPHLDLSLRLRPRR